MGRSKARYLLFILQIFHSIIQFEIRISIEITNVVVQYKSYAYYYNRFKYGDWSPTRIRLAPGRITNDGSDLEQQGSE